LRTKRSYHSKCGVANGPDERQPNRHDRRDALAARGYWQAFQSVKKSIEKIIGGAAAAAFVRGTYRDWYREMFQPLIGQFGSPLV
jgi:hypothetical protein